MLFDRTKSKQYKFNGGTYRFRAYRAPKECLDRSSWAGAKRTQCGTYIRTVWSGEAEPPKTDLKFWKRYKARRDAFALKALPRGTQIATQCPITGQGYVLSV